MRRLQTQKPTPSISIPREESLAKNTNVCVGLNEIKFQYSTLNLVSGTTGDLITYRIAHKTAQFKS